MAATSQTTDQSAIDVRGLVEQVTAGVRSEIEQMTADFRKDLTAEIGRRMAEREPHGHSASTYSRTGGSVNLLARVERDYEMAIDAAFNDLADLTISNTRLWSRLQKFYVDLFECSSRWSLEVQPRIYSETLKGIARDAPSERATMLPTEHRVNPVKRYRKLPFVIMAMRGSPPGGRSTTQIKRSSAVIHKRLGPEIRSEQARH